MSRHLLPRVRSEAIAVLLVTEERSFVQFAREELPQHGEPIRLLHAKTAAEARTIGAEERVSVVLVDEAVLAVDLEWLRELRSLDQVPAIALVTDENARRVWEAAGEVDMVVITEHVDGEALAACIRRALMRADARGSLLRTPSHLERLVQHSSELIFVVDADGRSVYESPAVAQLLGTGADTFHSLDGWVHPEDAGVARQLVARAATARATCRGSVRIPLASGAMATFDVVASHMSARPQGLVVLNAAPRRTLGARPALAGPVELDVAGLERVAEALVGDLEALTDALEGEWGPTESMPRRWATEHAQRLRSCGERVATLQRHLGRHRSVRDSA